MVRRDPYMPSQTHAPTCSTQIQSLPVVLSFRQSVKKAFLLASLGMPVAGSEPNYTTHYWNDISSRDSLQIRLGHERERHRSGLLPIRQTRTEAEEDAGW